MDDLLNLCLALKKDLMELNFSSRVLGILPQSFFERIFPPASPPVPVKPGPVGRAGGSTFLSNLSNKDQPLYLKSYLSYENRGHPDQDKVNKIGPWGHFRVTKVELKIVRFIKKSGVWSLFPSYPPATGRCLPTSVFYLFYIL